MKVLLLTNMFPSPAEPALGVFVRAQMESLEALGVDFDLEIIHGAGARRDYLWAAGRMNRRRLRTRYDLIHAHYGLSGLVGSLQAFAPLVVTFCGSDLLGVPDASGRYTASGKLQIRLSQLAALRAREVIVQSEEMARALPSSRPYHVIPYGLDFRLFAPAPREVACARLGLPADKRRVLFVGRVSAAVKRFGLAESAVRLLQERVPGVELYSMSGRPQDEVVSAMNACDALVLCSSHEGSPNVVREAMACNLPVVSTDVGDVRATFGQTPGHFIAEGTADGLASKLELALRAGRTRGREAIRHLSLEATAERILTIYRSAASSR